MIDFHSHILPDVDDGAEDIETSLSMLRESYRQGVRLICATPHFYADEDDPASFLSRRDRAFHQLVDSMAGDNELPEILLGAEVLFFPGISVAEEVRALTLGNTPFLLIEPPMMHWSEAMLEEIELCGKTLGLIPVIAHIDRYIRLLGDRTLFDRLEGRRLFIQVNADFFLHRSSAEFAMDCLRKGRFHFIGSDCHDLSDRGPNLGDAAASIRKAGLAGALDSLDRKVERVIAGASR